MSNPQPIRNSLLPCTPPAEWEFSSAFATGPDAEPGLLLVPGDSGPVVVRRQVTYGDWEPVSPDHWAPEPPANARAAASVSASAPTEGLALQRAADALWALANRTTERGAGVLWAADWLRNRAVALAVPASAPTDETALRDRIAAAVRTVPIKYGEDSITPVSREEAGILADAVLAVLLGPIPPDADVPSWTAIRAIQLMNEAGAGRDVAEAAIERVRLLHDRLAAETELASPDDPITRGDAAKRIATALDAAAASGSGRVADETRARCHCPHPADEHSVYGCADGCACEWMPKRSAPEESQPEKRQACHCGQDGCEYCDADDADEDNEDEEPTEEEIVREHVTTVHLIGEQLADVESWLWKRLAEVRAEQPAVVSRPDGEA